MTAATTSSHNFLPATPYGNEVALAISKMLHQGGREPLPGEFSSAYAHYLQEYSDGNLPEPMPGREPGYHNFVANIALILAGADISFTSLCAQSQQSRILD